MFFCSPESWVFDSLLHFLLLPGMAIHYYQEVIKMTLLISDVHVISAVHKKRGKPKAHTDCAELVDHSRSFQKDTESAALPDAEARQT